MKQYYGYIYKITNNLNGKIYVGLRTSSCFDKSYWGSGVHIHRAIQKYGVENFSREILQWCYTREELNDCERFWISKLNAQDMSVGYNITCGGEGGNTYQYLTEEQMNAIRPKLSMHNRDANTIKLWREHLRVSNTGENNPMYGKHHTADARQKMSDAKKGKFVPWNKGKPMTEEQKRKISESQKRRIAQNRSAHSG